MDLTRRKLVAASGTLVASTALSGCSGGGPDSDSQNGEPTDTQEQTESEQDSSTPTGDPDFEVQQFDLQPRMVPVGNEMAVNTAIKNVGDAPGIARFEFTLGSAQFSWESDEIEAGATSNDLTIRFRAPDIESARHDFVATLNGEEVATLPVDILTEGSPGEPGLYGTFVSATRADVSGGIARVSAFGSNDQNNMNEVELGDIGQFGSEPLLDGEYEVRVTYLSGMVSEFNGVPDIFAAERGQQVRDDTVILGQYTLPEAYRTEVRLVDESGSPVADFTPSVRDANGNGTRTFTTNENGYLVSDARTETGISLPPAEQSNIVVDARPSSGGRPERFGEIYGSPDGEEFELTVSDPDRF